MKLRTIAQRNILIAIFSLFAVFAWGQGKINVVFDRTTHDFGTIEEDEGVQTIVFSFVNLSDAPIFIKDIQSSCGCTTPQYSRNDVSPNTIGKIKVGYNPVGRPGEIRKSITVKFANNKETRTVVLYLRGNTLNREDNDTDKFSYTDGNVALRTALIDMGSVLKGNTARKTIEIYNPTDKRIKVDFASVPNNIDIRIDGESSIEPHSSVYASIDYKTSDRDRAGIYSYKIPIKVNRKNASAIEIKATVNDDFTHITTQEFARKPQIWLIPPYLNMGTLKRSKKYSFKTKIENRGSSPLTIDNIVAPEAPFISFGKLKKNVVNASESVELEIVVNTQILDTGTYETYCKVFGNDCESPVTDLYLEFAVE